MHVAKDLMGPPIARQPDALHPFAADGSLGVRRGRGWTMDVDVAHGIEYLVSGNHRFSVGLRHTRPSASIVTEQRAVCIDLARGVVDIDVAAADGERFLAGAFDRDMFVLLVIRGDDDLALTRFTPSGASQTTSLFQAPSTPMFPCALAIDAARTGILLNTLDGIWFTSRQTISLHPEPWPEPELPMGEIGEWFNPSMVDLVTPPGPGGPCCGLGYSPAPGNVAGGELVGRTVRAGPHGRKPSGTPGSSIPTAPQRCI